MAKLANEQPEHPLTVTVRTLYNTLCELWPNQPFEERLQGINSLLKLADALPQLHHFFTRHRSCPFRLSKALPAESASDQRRAIQAQAVDVEEASLTQGKKRAIGSFMKVLRVWIMLGMEQTPHRSVRIMSRPEIAFVAVASWTAIDQIIDIIRPASCTRLEVIKFQLCANFGLVYAAIAAPPGIAQTHSLP